MNRLPNGAIAVGSPGSKARQRETTMAILIAMVGGFNYDPGHSDLDDEQPIDVRISLGDYREARRLLRELEGR